MELTRRGRKVPYDEMALEDADLAAAVEALAREAGLNVPELARRARHAEQALRSLRAPIRDWEGRPEWLGPLFPLALAISALHGRTDRLAAVLEAAAEQLRAVPEPAGADNWEEGIRDDLAPD